MLDFNFYDENELYLFSANNVERYSDFISVIERTGVVHNGLKYNVVDIYLIKDGFVVDLRKSQ